MVEKAEQEVMPETILAPAPRPFLGGLVDLGL